MLTAPLRLVCPLPMSWLEKLASEVHVDPVAAVVQDAGQQLSSGLSHGQAADEVSLLQSRSLKLKRVTDL